MIGYQKDGKDCVPRDYEISDRKRGEKSQNDRYEFGGCSASEKSLG